MLSKTNLRELGSHSHTHTYTHIHTHTHQLKPTMHSAEGKATQACEGQHAGNRPTNNRGRHARPVASMRTKGGTSWRSRKRERVSACLEGRQRTFCYCWLARASDLLQLGLRALVVCACLCKRPTHSVTRSLALFLGRTLYISVALVRVVLAVQ